MSQCNNRMLKDGRWDFYNPVRVFAGVDVLHLLADVVKGSRILLLTTSGFSKRGVTNKVSDMLGQSLIEVVDGIEPNPELARLESLAQELRYVHCDTIVALGGGSVIDTAKVISATLPRIEGGFSLRAHLENNLGDLTEPGIPVVAIPTTAGTGAEVTPFATVWDSDAKKKYSLSGPGLFPGVALVDPGLTLTLPREQTITTGLDAISHAFESIWNRNATPITIMYATEALRIAMPTLPMLVDDLDNLQHRTKMLQASLFAGLAISNTKTALAHSISYPLTLKYGVPHGLACSFALPAILRFNAEEDDGRILKAALYLGCETVDNLVEYLGKLSTYLDVRGLLGQYVIHSSQIGNDVSEVLASVRASNNLRAASKDDVLSIIESSLN